MPQLRFPLLAREAYSFTVSLVWVVRFIGALFLLGVSVSWLAQIVTTSPSVVGLARDQIHKIPRDLGDAAGWQRPHSSP